MLLPLIHHTLEHLTIHKSSSMYVRNPCPFSRCTDGCWCAANHDPKAEHAPPHSPDPAISKACEPPCASQLRCIHSSPRFFWSPSHYHSTLSVLLNEHGGIINNTVITKHAEGTFYLVTNTGQRDKTLHGFFKNWRNGTRANVQRTAKFNLKCWRIGDWSHYKVLPPNLCKGYSDFWEYRSKVR